MIRAKVHTTTETTLAERLHPDGTYDSLSVQRYSSGRVVQYWIRWGARREGRYVPTRGWVGAGTFERGGQTAATLADAWATWARTGAWPQSHQGPSIEARCAPFFSGEDQ